MKKSKRFLCVLLAAIMTSSMLVGCNSNSSGGTSSTANDTSSTTSEVSTGETGYTSSTGIAISDPGEYPIVDETYNLDVFIRQAADISDLETNEVTKAMEELTNVHLDMTVATEDAYTEKLNLLLNTQLNGLTIEEINLGMIKKMKEQAGIHSGIISKVVDTVAEAIAVSEEDVPVYTSGATNIFKYPELSDSSKASQLISTFEERQKLVDMIKGAAEEQDGEENTGIQVYIGNESSMEPLRDCSVVTTTYDMGNGMRGTIGIVGPKRMDYENVVDNLKTLKVQLDAVFKKPDTGE